MSGDHNFWRERRAEADSNRGPSAYQPNALPLGQTIAPHEGVKVGDLPPHSIYYNYAYERVNQQTNDDVLN